MFASNFPIGILVILALFSAPASAHADEAVSNQFGGRDILVYVPDQLPSPGHRALVVVLHGGQGDAQRIVSGEAESALNLDPVADKDNFIVAYLNGTPVTRFLGERFLGWNAGGGCCGLPATNDIDDVAYIKGAVGFLATKYGIDRTQIYGIGHSNGAMMTQRLMCETDLYAAAVAISGPLNLDVSTCPNAHGKHILAIHGAEDENVPVAGGVGAKGLSKVAYKAEGYAKDIFLRSGATYTLEIVDGADHKLENIEAVITRNEGLSIGQKAAQFFGLQH